MRKGRAENFTQKYGMKGMVIIMKKRLISAILILMMLVTVAIVPVSAAVADPILPLWTNFTKVEATIVFADIYGEATGEAKATGATITGTLYVYEDGNPTPIYTQTKTASNRLTVTIEFEGEYGVEYTVVFNVTATKNGVTESASDSASEYC